MDDPSQMQAGASGLEWFGRGMLCLFSLPALILMGAFAGFAGIAKEAGISLGQVEFMVLMVWALPSKVVFIAAVSAQSSFMATFVAVALSSVRLMPMTMVIVPEMRTAKTRQWVLYVLAHFVAVTGWVIALERFKGIPRERRTAFFAGLVSALLVSNMLVVAATYRAAADLPPVLSAALVMVTPLYFLFSLWGSARERASHHAMVIGLSLTPVFHLIFPQADIIATGVTGGVLAYWTGRRKGVVHR